MSKELTEKWRNGTLNGGIYYLLLRDGTTVTDKTVYIVGEKQLRWHYSSFDFVKEVLAPVPTYEEWKSAYECQLMESEEVLTLKQQLKEAKKILYDVWDCRGSREYYAEKAKEYFEKWGVE